MKIKRIAKAEFESLDYGAAGLVIQTGGVLRNVFSPRLVGSSEKRIRMNEKSENDKGRRIRRGYKRKRAGELIINS